MIEILFGIPNYRYKVWLFRLILIFMVVITILFFLSLLSSFALTTIPIFEMIYHLMFPIIFLGSSAFMVSTIIRNGSGTAVCDGNHWHDILDCRGGFSGDTRNGMSFLIRSICRRI